MREMEKRLADGRYCLRIRTHLRKRFFAEKHTNKLLNDLLEKYYGKK